MKKKEKINKTKKEEKRIIHRNVMIASLALFFLWVGLQPNYTTQTTEKSVEDDGTDRIEIIRTHTESREKPYWMKVTDKVLLVAALGISGLYLAKYSNSEEKKKTKARGEK